MSRTFLGGPAATILSALFALILVGTPVSAQSVNVSIALDDSELFVGDDSFLTVTITETAGIATGAFNVSVAFPSAPTVLNIDDDGSSSLPAPTASIAGVPTRPDANTVAWAVTNLPASTSATLTVYFVVDTQFTGDFDIVATHDLGAGTASDTATLTIGEVFKFVQGAQVNTVAFKTLANSGLERMILGIYLGAPGVDGAIWCRVPTPDSDLLTLAGAPDSYRVCSDGLPSVSGTFLPLHPNDMWLDQTGTNAGRIYMTTWGGAGLYYSDDDANTWTAAEPDLGDGYDGNSGWVNVYAVTEDATDGILYISANNGLVFRSLNNGTSWQQVSSLPQGASDTPWVLVAHPDTPGTVFAGTFGKGVFVSTNFGISWSVLNGNDTTGGASDLVSEEAGHIFDLEIREDPNVANDFYLFAGTSRGVWRMEYSGAQEWEELSPDQNTLTPTNVSAEVRSIEFGADVDGDTDPDLYAVTWGFGVQKHKTPFDGALAAGGLADFALRGSEMTLFAVSPSGMLYAGTSDGAFYEMDPSNPILGSPTALEPGAGELPHSISLSPNYPNPFNPTTRITFELPEAADIRLAVYDLLGREVHVLSAGPHAPGRHHVSFDARGLSSGSYLYTLETPQGSITRSLTLIK